MGGAVSYPEEFIDRLEVSWGAGFLSPGGPDEVGEILRNVQTVDKSVLDIGCGVGGPAIVIAGDLDAREVVGIDVEPQLVARGAGNVANAGLQDRVDLILVESGPLPFADALFDIVFSKDALIHIEDKPALYREILRVLKPGGIFAASDWLAAENSGQLPEFVRWLEVTPHSFVMQSAAQAETALRDAGFADVSSRDRNAWYADLAGREVELLKGPLRERFLDVGDEATYRQMIEIRQANAAAARCGGLRPTHFRCAKLV